MKRYKFFLIFFILVLINSYSKYAHASFIGVSPSILPSINCSSGPSCGLVGYWTFDGKDMVGGAIRDRSGNGNSGNLINIASSTFYTLGKNGQGFNFDGVDDYVNVNSSTSLSPTSRITMSAWVKPNKQSSVAYMAVIEKSLSYNMYMRQDGIFLVFLTGVNNWITTSGSVDLFNGSWHHIVTTYDGATQILYIDNKLISSTSASGSITTNSNAVKIGDSGGVPVRGIIDDVRIYNRDLSVSEISQLYSSGVSNKQSSSQKIIQNSSCVSGLSCGLVGYWTFDGKDMLGGVARDRSGNSNNGNLINIATSTFFVPGKIGQGFNFDGTNDTVNAGSATVIDNLSAMSISMWVKLNTYGASGGGYLINKGDTSSGGHGWSMYLTQGNGLVTFTARHNTTSLLSQSASNTFASSDINKWVHLIVTWDGTTNSTTGVRIYKNGSEISYSTQTNGSGAYLSDASDDLNIGDGGLISNRQSNGIIDDVRIYNRVLSQSEITQLYNTGK